MSKRSLEESETQEKKRQRSVNPENLPSAPAEKAAPAASVPDLPKIDRPKVRLSDFTSRLICLYGRPLKQCLKPESLQPGPGYVQPCRLLYRCVSID